MSGIRSPSRRRPPSGIPWRWMGPAGWEPRASHRPMPPGSPMRQLPTEELLGCTLDGVEARHAPGALYLDLGDADLMDLSVCAGTCRRLEKGVCRGPETLSEAGRTPRRRGQSSRQRSCPGHRHHRPPRSHRGWRIDRCCARDGSRPRPPVPVAAPGPSPSGSRRIEPWMEWRCTARPIRRPAFREGEAHSCVILGCFLRRPSWFLHRRARRLREVHSGYRWGSPWPFVENA